MGRLDTSRAGQLRLLAERLRRSAGEMTMANYIEMMERAAHELDEEAGEIEADALRSRNRPGRHLDIIV